MIRSVKKQSKLKKYRRNLVKADWRTFNGWKEVGRHVIKGQKCSRDKDGRAIFHISQTDIDNVDNWTTEDEFAQYVQDEIYKDNWMFT